MPNKSERLRNELDERILDEVRQGPRTQDELITEVGETESRIRSRLQFLGRAGYMEKNEVTGEYELRDDPEKPGVFEEHPRLRWLAYGVVFLVSEIIYFYFLDVVIESALVGIVPPSVALVFSLPFAWMTAWILVPPRHPLLTQSESVSYINR